MCSPLGAEKVLSQCGRGGKIELHTYKVRAMPPPIPTFASVKTVRATSEEDAKEIMKERLPRATVFHVWRPEPGRRRGDS
jgi:hypothetical protein